MTLVKVYCATAVKKEWRRRDRRAAHTHSRCGLVYAEVKAPGWAICLCCSKAVRVVER